jgi:hypothetical protein
MYYLYLSNLDYININTHIKIVYKNLYIVKEVILSLNLKPSKEFRILFIVLSQNPHVNAVTNVRALYL